jgi:hypothetical protein
MRKALLVLAVAALAGAFASPAAANHSWGGYHWARTANPFTLKVGDNATTAWDTYLDQALADWNPSSVLNVTKVAGGSKGKNCRPTTGRIEVCNGSYGNNGWLGLAQIWASGTHISQGTTKLNDTYFTTAQYNTPPWRRLVMCQEVAHDFGLAHQNEAFGPPNLGSCMDYTNDPDGGGAYGPSNEHPNSHDFAQLETIYNSHLDSSTTVGAVGTTGAPLRVERVDTISDSTITEHYGNGLKKITHVTWAIGVKPVFHDRD